MPANRRRTDAPAHEWLTVAEAAEHVKVTQRSIRGWLAESKLTAYRLNGGRLIRIDRAELDAVLVPFGGGGAA